MLILVESGIRLEYLRLLFSGMDDMRQYLRMLGKHYLFN